MSVFWLQPYAWWGLAALAIPIAIHLLARQKRRRLPFPSLRFLTTTPLAALRRRVVSDWPLLAVRLLVLAAAIAALALPVFVSDARRNEWDRRVARAMVVLSEAENIVQDEARTSFASVTFQSPSVADGIRSSLLWFARQPPAAQELVIIGDLREGAVVQHDFAGLPPHVGIRFVPTTAGDAEAQATLLAVGDIGDGATALQEVRLRANYQHTAVAYVRASDQARPRLAVRAAATDQAHADAVLGAVLAEGVLIGWHGNRQVTIAFAGAPAPATMTVPSALWARQVLEQLPGARGGEVGGVLVVTTPMTATHPQAAAFVSRVAALAFPERQDHLEPRRVPPSSLAAWSRPPGGAPESARPADEGDRRWVWAAAAIALAVEQLLRRSRLRQSVDMRQDDQEARVA